MQIRPLTPELFAKIQALHSTATEELANAIAKCTPALPETYAAQQKAQGKEMQLGVIATVFALQLNPVNPDFNLMSFLLDQALASPDDTWSGRTNDAARSRNDGRDAALRAVHELLKY